MPSFPLPLANIIILNCNEVILTLKISFEQEGTFKLLVSKWQIFLLWFIEIRSNM